MKRFLVLMALVLSACAGRGDLALTEGGAVQTPVYSANKVLFALPAASGEDARYAQLKEGYELAGASATIPNTRRPVRNRDPLSIVVSRAYVPASLTSCATRMSDALHGATRDIAVLLDVSTAPDRQEFIAVWYQRDVPPDQVLTFQDLLVYSSDSWDAKYPPYFRIRLVDVSAERNTATGAMLEQVRSTSSTIAGLLGSPEVSPVLGIAALAAKSVLAHEKNKSLVDFTFQLYDSSLLEASGGVPLGVLQTGGVVVTAQPCGSGVDYWNNDLRFDHRLQRIQDKSGAIQQVPFVFTTILTADLSVPQVVRTRSAAIMKRLSDPKVEQGEIDAAREDAESLQTSLAALSERERFRRRPSKDSFGEFVSTTDTQFDQLDNGVQGYFLDAFYQITGRSLPSPSAYKSWLANCGEVTEFDAQTGRFVRDPAKKGKDGALCFPG